MMRTDQLALKASQGLALFVFDFTVLYRSRDELARKNSELEASLKAASAAQKSSDLALADANKEKEATFKELEELRRSYDTVCTSKLAVVEENKELAEKTKKLEFEAATINESSYNAGRFASYEDAEAQIGYISRSNFKKGWDRALLAAEVDVDSSLFEEHAPGPKPVIEGVPPPATNEGVPAVPTTAADAPIDQGMVSVTSKGGANEATVDRGKKPASSQQTLRMTTEPPFRPREKLAERQRMFQSIHKHTYLKGPFDRITSVAIPLALASTSLFLIGRGIYNMSHGIGKKE